MTKNSKDDLSLNGTRPKMFTPGCNGQVQFPTRTRLRPGGPQGRSYASATLRNNGSLPSFAATEGFEEIAMRTLSQKPEFRGYWDTAGPKTMYPPTPLVKQRTTGCASPRVQMYKTRVFYSEKDPNSAMGQPNFNLGGKNIPEASV